jgi:YegS/Rv2252/BmrU family lipid kinase
VVVNTESGAGRTGSRWPAIARELSRSELQFDAVFTRQPGDATRLAAEGAAGGYAAVVAVGGDGTVNEVVNGLMAAGSDAATRPALGVLPGGSAQDFARSAGIPLDMRAAARFLARAQPRPVDVGCIRFAGGGMRYFANYAGTGFDATVAAHARSVGHPFRGALAYVVGFFRVLHGYTNRRFSVRLNGGPPLVSARRINMVILANGTSYAGYLRMAPGASLDDGLLDVIVIGDVGRLELLVHLPLALFGRHLEHPKVIARRARTATITAAEPVPVQSDGELAGQLPAEFAVIPGALRLLSA